MTKEQAYINGFVKKASEYGYSEDEALYILKQAGPTTGVVQPAAISLPSKTQLAPYNGVKTFGEMWNEWKTGQPTLAPKQPVSKGPPQTNPNLVVK